MCRNTAIIRYKAMKSNSSKVNLFQLQLDSMTPGTCEIFLGLTKAIDCIYTFYWDSNAD